MTKKVFLAGLFHESHSFLSGVTQEVDFTTFQGEDLVVKNRDNGSPISAVLQYAHSKAWEVIPSLYSHAMPGPIVEQSFLDKTFSIILKDLAENIHSIDGIYLILHGAMVSGDIDDVEGELLERIHHQFKNHSKNIPVCGVLDLHCNFTQRMADYSSALVAYKKNPHTDAGDAAVAGAKILGDLMILGGDLHTVYRHPSIVLPPVFTATNSNPMRALLEKARDIEEEDSDILATNIFAGFSYSDTEDTGLSFSIVTKGSLDKIQSYLDTFSKIAYRYKAPQVSDELNLDDLLPKLEPSDIGPILLIEASDNIGGGTPGDGTSLLEKLLAYQLDNFAVVINDPEAAQLCLQAGLNSDVELFLGGKVDTHHGEPVQVRGRVVNLSDGRFELEDKKSHLASMVGTHAHMGFCATLAIRNSRILITSLKTPPMDLGQLRSQGIIPEKMGFIGIKAALAHKAVYDAIAAASYYVDTPGLGTNDLSRLPYQKIKRPIYPLDSVTITESTNQ